MAGDALLRRRFSPPVSWAVRFVDGPCVRWARRILLMAGGTCLGPAATARRLFQTGHLPEKEMASPKLAPYQTPVVGRLSVTSERLLCVFSQQTQRCVFPLCTHAACLHKLFYLIH